MGNEKKEYGSNQRKKLMDDFKRTVELMKIEGEHRELISDELQEQLHQEYEKIIPEIPCFIGYRQRMFNTMLIFTSQILAAYRVLKRYGRTPDEIWEICHEALQLRLHKIPKWKRWCMKQFWNNIFAAILKRRGKNSVKEELGNFKLEYLSGEGENYDYGINYTKCGHQAFLKEQEAEEIFPYVCLADSALSDAFGWGLIRTQTIGDGCTYCDFRFKNGSTTKITSRTPEVQKTIDNLSDD